MLHALLLAAALAGRVPALVESYLEAWFDTFPSRATEAGKPDYGWKLESLPASRRAEWLAFNRRTAMRLREALAAPDLSRDDRLDAELLLHHVDRVLFDWGVRKRPERDPLFWTEILAGAHVHLLVRDDLPFAERHLRARARARQIPRLAAEAREALATTPPSDLAAEPCRLAASQARATAAFYGDGFIGAAAALGPEAAGEAASAGAAAATSLRALADYLDGAARTATGSSRLGSLYAESLLRGTGASGPVDSLLAAAEAALVEKRKEAAAYGRSVWPEIFPAEPAPDSDRLLLARLFARIAEDRAHSVPEFVEDYRRQVAGIEAFLKEKGVVTLPDPLTLVIDVSPPYFSGQAVGGVYPAGPYAPESKTLFFLPTPPDGATPAERDAFFRDFNHHFNVMITPHEILPGHYLQAKWAARGPRKVRALFPDEVFVEGWGTFCERLLLDLGWGGPLDRVAHLKKQMENIARTIVDIRVHAKGMTREDALRFVTEEALQDERFAANMWTRAITTSPQITTYWLGYRELMSLYEEAKARGGAAFSLKAFLDGVLAAGPLPVARIRESVLPNPPAR
ncbi:MAG TPA: DUF885 family protein [Thermoanaerobaculia bacterium]|nr:DUF885 family protein [Thermoanaerobaculia bacterium]